MMTFAHRLTAVVVFSLYGCSALSVINPATIPVDSDFPFVVTTDVAFATVSSAKVCFQPDTFQNNGNICSTCEDINVPMVIDNSTQTVAGTLPNKFGNTTEPGVAQLRLVGKDKHGAKLLTNWMSVSVYRQPTSMILSHNKCPSSRCTVTITLDADSIASKATLQLSGAGIKTRYMAATKTAPKEFLVVMKSLPYGSHDLKISLNGINYATLDKQVTLEVSSQLPLRVCFVFVGGLADYGWTYRHNYARLQLEKFYAGGVETRYVANVGEDYKTGASVMRKMATVDGCKLIIGTSYGYMDAMVDLSIEFPALKWLHISGWKTTPSLSTGFARMYHTKYIAGLIVGGQIAVDAKTGKGSSCVTYLLPYRIPEVVRHLNAFTLGCKTAYPDCEVNAMWIGTWHNKWIEDNAAREGFNVHGCRYMTQNTDSLSPQKVIKGLGGIGVGSNVDVRAHIGDSVLISTMFEWFGVYAHFVDQLLEDSWVPKDDYWPGISTGAVSLSAMSPKVDTSVRVMVNAEIERLTEGNEVFCGPLYNNTGHLIAGTGVGRCLGDFPELLTMDFLIDGVNDTGTYVAPPEPKYCPPGSGIPCTNEAGMLMNESDMIILGSGLVIFWALLAFPPFIYLRKFSGADASQMKKGVMSESVLDAAEIFVGLLIMSSFTSNMSTVQLSQTMVVFVSVINLVLANLYLLYTLHTAGLNLDIQRTLVLRHFHCVMTMMFVIPELALEVLLYYDQQTASNLICLMILCIDVGVRYQVIMETKSWSAYLEELHVHFILGRPLIISIQNEVKTTEALPTEPKLGAQATSLHLSVASDETSFSACKESKDADIEQSFQGCCAVRS